MDEKQRTKVLGGVLAGFVGIIFGKPILMKPIDDAKRNYIVTDRNFEDATDKDWQVDLAKQNIENARLVSLPPRVSDAQRLYLSWITNLAEQCNFAQLEVTPGAAKNNPGKYVEVAVNIECETSMEGLGRFLYLFEQADLLHRVASLDIKSSNAQGTPRLDVKLTAEGLSVAGSSSKGDIFSKTYLPKPLDPDATEVVVNESADFPDKPPFKAQVGTEMVNVLAVDGNKWEIERGVEGTKAVKHVDNEYVQLFPIAGKRSDIQFTQYEDFVRASLFTKPAPTKIYKPDLEVASKTIEPGKILKMTVKAKDINLDIGKPSYAMEGGLEGMTLDSETGEFEWTPPEDAEAARHDLKFILTQTNNEDLKVEKTASVSIQLENGVPTLEVASEAVVILGRDFSMELKAEDDGGPDGLKYSLEGDAPSGLTVDGTSLKWNPPNTFTPGEYEFSVKVTDSGTPAKTATKTVKLEVQDDTAASTRFTAAVGLDGIPVAWFWNQVENKRPELRLGERLAVADIDAKLTEISKRYVLMSDDAGIWKLNLGDNVRQRELIEPAEPSVPEQQPATESTTTEVNADSEGDGETVDTDSTDETVTPAEASEGGAEPNEEVTPESNPAQPPAKQQEAASEK